MQGIAAFIMRNRLIAILVVVGATSLPLLAWLAGAALALVTLRRGVTDGLLVMLGAAATVWAIYGFLGVPLTLALRPVIELWLPVIAVAAWLRQTVSLSSAIRFAAGLAALAVVVMHVSIADQRAFWRAVLEGASDNGEGLLALFEHLLPLMTGLYVLTVLALVVISVLTGRAFQAALYNPGGFRAEFHALDLGRTFGLVSAALLASGLLLGTGLVYDMAVVVGGVFVLQVLALVHSVIGARGMSGGWLVPVYILVPLAFQVVMIVGIADAIFDWRKRLLRSGSSDM